MMPSAGERRKQTLQDKKEWITMTKVIDIKTKEQAEKISDLASKAPYEVWLSTDTVMLDARSLLGILSLVGKRASVVAEDNVNPRSFSKLVDKMAKRAKARKRKRGGCHHCASIFCPLSRFGPGVGWFSDCAFFTFML